MMQASSTFQVVSLNFQPCSTPVLRVLNKNSRNNEPCTGPIIFTREGSWNAYFNGTAINTSTSREMPSRIAIILSLPVLVLNN